MTAFAVASLNVNAKSVDVTAARAAAGKFIQQNTAIKFRSSSLNSIKLAHAEKSSVKDNAYYVFNIDGGGWVIIAGDDRAKQVLAYGDNGSIDMNGMPDNMKSYLNRYKSQIELLQNYKGEVEPMKIKSVEPVEPLLRSIDWAQQSPFNYQCPTYNGSRSSVGCAALAMAQVVNYWEYPTDFPALGGYQNAYNYQMVPSLPARTIDYSLIRDQYTYFNDEGKLDWVDGVTDEEKQEVAWLCRYCAQACVMNFSPDGSGSNVDKQRNAFLNIGYSTDARLLGIEAWPSRNTWNTTDYTDDEWTAIMTAELQAHHPLPYSCEGWDLGHAFVVDGVDADGLYHVNWGWYGRGDGWFQHKAFNVTVQGQYMEFNESLFMIVDLYPYEGYVSPNDPNASTDDIPGDINGDHILNVSDVTLLIQMVLNQEEVTLDMDVVDINGDTQINVADVTALIQMVLSH